MQRYSRDRQRDDESVRDERGSQARNESRFARSSNRDPSTEYGGWRDSYYARSSGDEAVAYGSNPGSNRWRDSGQERDRFEQSNERGSRGRDDYATGAHRRNRDEDDYRGRESDARTAWQPGRESLEDQWDYGETEYGMYGPRYSGYPGGAIPGTGHADDLPGARGAYGRGAYGNERADDRYGRQGYGQSEWQRARERNERRFDADYLKWREEQIRELDADYQRYREERYRKFSEDFDAWRKTRQTARNEAASASPRETGSQGVSEDTGDPLDPSRNK
jgi:hypothetical protein